MDDVDAIVEKPSKSIDQQIYHLSTCVFLSFNGNVLALIERNRFNCLEKKRYVNKRMIIREICCSRRSSFFFLFAVNRERAQIIFITYLVRKAKRTADNKAYLVG